MWLPASSGTLRSMPLCWSIPNASSMPRGNRKRAGGRAAPLGPLDGVPATRSKTTSWSKGWPTRRGSRDQRSGASRHRCSGSGAPARTGRRHSRQDLHARAWLDRRLPQPAHRHHAQSVESGAHTRRLDRRRGGGGLARSRTAASWHRWRRLAAHPGGVHRRVRHEAELRTRAGLSGGVAGAALASRTDRAQRRRCRTDAGGDRAAGCARHGGLDQPGAGFCGRTGTGRARSSRRVLGAARTGGGARPGDRSRHAQGGARAGRAGRDRRGGRSAARARAAS